MREEISGIGRGEESLMGVLPERLLLATDGSEDAERATMAALDLTGHSGAELHVVHVWHDVRGFARDFVKRELRSRGQEVLDGQVEKIEAAGWVPCGASGWEPNPRRECTTPRSPSSCSGVRTAPGRLRGSSSAKTSP